MALTKYNYLDDLAAAVPAGGKSSRIARDHDHTYHWSRRVIRLYAAALLGVVTLAITVGPYVGEFLGPALAGQRAYALQRVSRSLGPVMSESDRIKFAVIESVVNEKFVEIADTDRARIAEKIYVASKRHGVDPLLALAIIRQESNYEQEAESFVGALGLMQVRPFVGKEVATRLGIKWNDRETLLDPGQNVEIGIAYLAQMKKLFQSSTHALMAYNLGPYRLKGMLERNEDVPSHYSDRVLRFYRGLQRDYLTALMDASGVTGSGDENQLAMAGGDSDSSSDI